MTSFMTNYLHSKMDWKFKSR